MQFRLLPETDSLLEVLLRPTFAVSFCTTTLVMLAITYYMEKMQREDASAPVFLVHRTTYFDVLSFTLLLSVTVFTNSSQVTRAVACGQSPPISLKRLERLPAPLNVVCASYGDRKLVAFATQMVCSVGVLATACLYGLSFYVNGAERATEWRVPLNRYLASSMLWRLLVSSAIYTLNYLAAHNPTQSVLVPARDSDAPEGGSKEGKKHE